ncbi:peptidase inhibitor family I36 protein [Streptomyces sp. NPDC048507]|uniref:peptidase inhibitor family I36 protein n=1 Tax=Streptomyces sp. NPDC048507 TaxID=3365560 RepID=UPI00371A243D
MERFPTGRRVGALGAACLALALGTALAPAAAGAAPEGPAVREERCAPGWVCGWTGPAYTGVVSLAAQDVPRFPETTAYVGFNDAASVWNGAAGGRDGGATPGRCVTVYNAPGYAGRGLTLAPGRGVAHLPASFGHVHSARFHGCRPS